MFEKGRTVILRSHLKKYLFADDDGEKVRQSRNGSSRSARWTVELVEGKHNVVRLKSFHGRYLTASEMPFLLGMTGKKVIQSMPSSKWDSSIEWEAQNEGFHQVKLRSWGGTYLRANGGTPPWRNSITHDIPEVKTTQDWVLWDVEVVENSQADSIADYQSQLSSFSSASEELGIEFSEPNSPVSITSNKSPKFSFSSMVKSPNISFKKSPRLSITGSEKDYCDYPQKESFTYQSGMELFYNAKAVRLRGHHDKYLLADEDEESVIQERNGSSRNARWIVEFLDNPNLIRLKSCYGKYLTASDVPFLLGMTGHKVLQTLPSRLDSSVEWEPLREGFQVRLKTHHGNFLRANGGLPPWRNSVTHDTPHVSATKDWILWDVDIVEIRVDSPIHPSPQVVHRKEGRPPVDAPAPPSLPVVNRKEGRPPVDASAPPSLPVVNRKEGRPPVDAPALPSPMVNLDGGRPPFDASTTPSPVVHRKQHSEPPFDAPTIPSPMVHRKQYSEPASPRLTKTESSDSFVSSPPKPDGRTIYYNIADEYGDTDDDIESPSLIFKGSSVQELTQRLEKETGLQGITVCSRNILNDKLYRLRLHLPPNNATMHVVVVPPSSKVARDLPRP